MLETKEENFTTDVIQRYSFCQVSLTRPLLVAFPVTYGSSSSIQTHSSYRTLSSIFLDAQWSFVPCKSGFELNNLYEICNFTRVVDGSLLPWSDLFRIQISIECMETTECPETRISKYVTEFSTFGTSSIAGVARRRMVLR